MLAHPDTILALWVALAWWMAGITWFVQAAVYPLFAKVGEANYVDYHRFYTRRIPLVVILPGFAGFLLPIPLAFFGPDMPQWMGAGNIAAGLVGLAVTVFLQIPRHNRLEAKGKDSTLIADLVRYNWIRTVSVTVQAVLALLMLLR